MRVLVIEDEAPLRQRLVRRLTAEGYLVDEAADGDEGAWRGAEYPLDAAIVDLGLPGRSGIQVIGAWRAAGHHFPVLILTARGRWQDKVEGLEAGADDYLAKPFQMEELLARLRALIRRSGGWGSPVLECPPLVLDPGARRVPRDGEPVDLTAYEYRLLEMLMLRAGQVVSKAELSEHLYQEELDPDSNVLEVLVGRLRRKLDPQRTLEPIATRRGQGYLFRLPKRGE